LNAIAESPVFGDMKRTTLVLLILSCGAPPPPTGIYAVTQTIDSDTCGDGAMGTYDEVAIATDAGYSLMYQEMAPSGASLGAFQRTDFTWDGSNFSWPDVFDCDGGVTFTAAYQLLSDSPTIEATARRGYEVPTGCTPTPSIPPMTCETQYHLSYALKQACEPPCGVKLDPPTMTFSCVCP
jgi:hypothetical protein